MSETVLELVKHVGKTATITDLNGLTFYVKILNVEKTRGIIRFLVSPFAGRAEAWVSETSLEMIEGVPDRVFLPLASLMKRAFHPGLIGEMEIPK